MSEFSGDFLQGSGPSGLLAHMFNQDYPLDMALPQHFSASQDVPLMSALAVPGLVPGPVSSPPPGLSSSGLPLGGPQHQQQHPLSLPASTPTSGRPQRAARPDNLRERSALSGDSSPSSPGSSSEEEESSWASSGAESPAGAPQPKQKGSRARARATASKRGTKRGAAARRSSVEDEEEDSSTADEGTGKSKSKKKKKGGRRIELDAALAAKVASGKPLSAEEERKVKKQRRLIKNREAAQQFRRRQKAYIADLETKVDTLGHENKQFTDKMTVLQNENHLLKQQLDYLRTFLAKAVAVAIPVAPGQSLEHVTAPGLQGLPQ